MRAVGLAVAAVLAAVSLLIAAPALADQTGGEARDRAPGSGSDSRGASPAMPGTEGGSASGRTVQPETVVTELEDELMCPVCGTLLGLADAPQAHRQRAMIERLANRGYSKDEIKDVMVDEFGAQVLPTPEPSGFNLSAYIVPIAGVPVALIALAVGILRWRRQGGSPARSPDGTPAEGSGSAEAERRLDADLDRYDL